jgi:hypothetical protein
VYWQAEDEEWLVKKHSEYLVTTPSMRQLKLLIEEPSENCVRDLLALDRKQCILVTGLLTDHHSLKCLVHVMGLLDNAVFRKCGQKEESPCHILLVGPQSNRF